MYIKHLLYETQVPNRTLNPLLDLDSGKMYQAKFQSTVIGSKTTKLTQFHFAKTTIQLH